jgi:thiamine biosynthesis lipoprotein
MLSRRAALQIGIAALASGCNSGAKDDMRLFEFEALGAPAFIKLENISRVKANNLFEKARTEAARLEAIFSLYQKTSEISRLNRDGKLTAASPEMIEVLHAARGISEITNGAFDITAQALWRAAQNVPKGKVAAEAHWRAAYDLVDYRFVEIKGRAATLTRPGVSISLNAIAQGYITDKVCELLQSGGALSGLVNIGEFRAFGPKVWNIGIQNPRNPVEIIETIALRNGALATSSASGGFISENISHIFGPNDIYVKPRFISASVMADSAMMADGLATAFTLMEPEGIKLALRNTGAEAALLIGREGEILRL